MQRRRTWGVCGLALILTAGLSLPLAAQEKQQVEAKPKADAKTAPAPRIQVAILLDHSGSMSGLINQAREHIWKIVNEFATLKRNGQEPQLEVALYKYGAGRPEQLVALTDDLDKVSQELFGISIAGGTENCGQVIKAATDELKWSTSDQDLKCIFIAGNERFTQGPVDYKVACKLAINNGITVNTIHCGSLQAGINGMWQDGALLADGSYVQIDQNQATVDIKAPQDKKIAELNTKLNTTYIAFGEKDKREALKTNQAVQDSNASGLNSYAFNNRANFKASNQYICRWDLVDACRLGHVKLKDVKKEHLPKELQGKSEKEIQAWLDKKLEERKGIQKQIKDLNDARVKYVTEERKKLATEKGGNTLDTAIIETVRKQAERKNYQVKE